jgi:hypothetical protein
MGRRENCLSLVVDASRTSTISFSSNTRHRRTGADRYVIMARSRPGTLDVAGRQCRRYARIPV